MNRLNNQGLALYIVLSFSAVCFTVIGIYIMAQMNYAKTVRTDPARLQALLNARSGIWYGISMLQHAMQDSVQEADTPIDSSQKSTSILFSQELLSVDDLTQDSTTIQPFTLTTGETTAVVSLFDSTKFGAFSLFLHPSEVYKKLESKGTYRQFTGKAIVTFGSQPFTTADTVLYVDFPGIPQGRGSIDGMISFIEWSIDKSDSIIQKRFLVDMEEVNVIKSRYKEALTSIKDSTFRAVPLTISADEDFAEIRDTVLGPLFIDGTGRDLSWSGSQRQIYVLEELQITGSVNLSNVKFVVAGDVKCYDKSNLTDVTIFTAARIFFANECSYSGYAFALSDVEIMNETRIRNKSIIISTGEPIELPPQKGIPDQKISPEHKTFCIFVRDKAQVDGILIDLSKKTGIKTDPQTVITGIVWTEGRFCHQGDMAGIVRTGHCVDEENPLAIGRVNVINGSLKVLPTVTSYFLPYYFGVPTIMDWREE
ncbi:MAG: hypothetical protein JW795_22485 [Chitinivibrionales bacterium]|nr:hypothetical protein [Chitinivibrionales bacterium]